MQKMVLIGPMSLWGKGKPLGRIVSVFFFGATVPHTKLQGG